MSSAKTLFLDFDGVLHPNLAKPEELLKQLPPMSAVLEGCDVRIVISSSWRFHHTLDEILAQLPTDLCHRVIGTTGPAVIGKFSRWKEILTYVQRHKFKDWRALDDSAFEFPADCKELILCNGSTGLGNRELELLREWIHSRFPSPP
jgi:hypothetical protein